MKVNRTQQIIIKNNPELDYLCHLTKNLYNYANYCIRRRFIKSGRFISAYTLIKIFSRINQVDYRALPTQTAQQTLILLEKNWKSFFKSIKDYKKNPDKYLGRPGLPKYKKKNGRSVAVFTNQQCRIKDGYIQFPRKIDFTVETTVDNLKQVRIIPQSTCYKVEIVYEKEVKQRETDKSRVIGIDIGLKNVATIVNNTGLRPVVVKGNVVKSINQFYNKKKARLQSIYDKQGIKSGSKMNLLTAKRNRKVNDQLHKISRLVIDYAIQNRIGRIIIGYNPKWKQRINIGKKNNQSFVQLPFLKLINQISYKGEDVSIETIQQEESHTSKCSFLDNESVKHHENYIGKRTSRGLFRTEKGYVINADVNAGLNIIRKSNPEAISSYLLGQDRGAGLVPFRRQPDKQDLLKLAKVA